MKKLLLILVVALTACGGPATGPATITGHVENPAGEEVEIYYVKEFVTNTREEAMAILDENNRFSASLPLEEPRLVSVRIPRRSISLYLEPGAEVNVSFDADDTTQMPDIEGDLIPENRVLAGYNADVANKYARMTVLSRAEDMDPNEFRQYVNEIWEEKLNYLENDVRYDELNEDFLSIMRANIQYEKLGQLMEYPMAAAHFRELDSPMDLPEDYYDFLDDASTFDDQYTNLSSYVAFLNAYQNYMMEKNEPSEGYGDRDYYEIMFEQSYDAFSGETRDIALAGAVISMIRYGDFELAGEHYEQFMDLATSDKFKELVDAEYQQALDLSPGKPAPEFTLTDINGEEVSLSDFSGQVVYLDFWASWCGPCMREVPYARELKTRMEGHDDLVFLYISVDTDEEAWRSKVAEENIKGVHLNVSGFSHEVPASYNLRGVPTFYLIGRDGHIIDNRPPRPSHEDIDEVLLAALEE
ncbi:MAG: redoxin family protein [Bacteroidales bacterium]